MSRIELQQVVKRFDSTTVVHGIDLAVNEGEFVVLVGPSGCGKSTLLRMLAGLEEVSGGKILIGGRDVTYLPPRERNIAMVFQDYALYPHMTVRDNIGFGLRLRGVPDAERTASIAEAAQTLEIGHLLDRKPAALSGGQRQRVAMGRCLVRSADAFLFDEPLSNLDAKLRATMRAEIKRFHRRTGVTTIYVTHDQVEAMTLADRIVCLDGGRIAQQGSPDDLYRSPANRFVAGFIGSPPMNFIEGGCDTEGNGVAFVMPDGQRLRLSSGVKVRAGTKAVLGLRPEHLTNPDAARAAQPAQIMLPVSLSEPLGADTLVHGQWGKHAVIARCVPGTRAMEGESLCLVADMAQAHLFDPASGVAWR